MGYSYIGKCQFCGNCQAAIIDDAQHKLEVAREISRWIRAGLTAERVESEWVRTTGQFCKCK